MHSLDRYYSMGFSDGMNGFDADPYGDYWTYMQGYKDGRKEGGYDESN